MFDEKVVDITSKEHCSNEEVMEIIKEDFPREYVPEKARWQTVVTKTENIGEHIDEAFDRVVANPSFSALDQRSIKIKKLTSIKTVTKKKSHPITKKDADNPIQN